MNRRCGILSTLALLLLCGCEPIVEPPPPPPVNTIYIQGAVVKYSILEIDGCQYLSYPTAYGYQALTHKGNCTNVVHGHER